MKPALRLRRSKTKLRFEQLESRRVLAAIGSGQEITDSIEIGQADDFDFDVTAGDTISVNIGETEGTGVGSSPFLTLFGPDGVAITEGVSNDSNSGANASSAFITASVSGTYTARVSERFNDTTLAYRISVSGITMAVMPTLGFENASSTTGESTATAVVLISLSEAATGDVTVPFTVTGNATDGNDFTISGSPVTIAAGQTSATVTILVEDDDEVEGAETIVVTLGSPTNANLGSATVHTITILDNDSAVDTIAPMITEPADVSVEGDRTTGSSDSNFMIAAFLAGATATDNVTPSPVITNNAPEVFLVGATTVTFTATDEAGNTSTATATVTVTDATAPSVTAPADITVNGNVSGGADATLTAITAFLAGASVTDIVDATVDITNNAPALFPVGDTTVTFTGTDAAGNTASATAVVTVNQLAGDPSVNISPNGPGGIPDPEDLPGGPQPSSWSLQRSSLREILFTFDGPINLPTASDIVLTNLGVNADVDPDTVINLRDDQISLSSDSMAVTISLDAGQLTDGVYQLELLGGVTGGDSFTLTGDSTNQFYELEGDWNGSGGVNIQDFATFAYWFSQPIPTAPNYVDLNDSGGVNIQDFAGFAANFGQGIVFPGEAASATSDGAAEGELAAALTTLLNPIDTDGDGSVTSQDALNVIDSLIQDGTSSGVGYSALDANRDGDVSARDALYVINRIEVNQAIAQIVNDDSDDRESIVDQLLLDDNIGKLF